MMTLSEDPEWTALDAEVEQEARALGRALDRYLDRKRARDGRTAPRAVPAPDKVSG